jgi:hypothetical protein
MSILVFWVVTRCGFASKYRSFGGKYRLYLEDFQSREKLKSRKFKKFGKQSKNVCSAPLSHIPKTRI